MTETKPTPYPSQIVVCCDTCGREVEHDYVVHDLMTRGERLAVARAHLASNERWSCTPDGDFCPDCKEGPVTHWLTRYDPDDGEPYGTLCDCDLGADHDGDGNPTP